MSSSSPSAIPQPSSELVARARKGERDARERLAREIYPVVLHWARVQTPGEADAQDLTQDVVVRVLRNLRSFRGDARFTTWLYRVVRNAAVDRRQRERRRRDREEGLEVAHDIPAEAHEPGERLDRAAALRSVREAFRKLPARQREIFDLADVQGLTSPEIAEKVGVAPSTVRVTLMKARRAIRSAMLESDPELVEDLT